MWEMNLDSRQGYIEFLYQLQGEMTSETLPIIQNTRNQFIVRQLQPLQIPLYRFIYRRITQYIKKIMILYKKSKATSP